jgi:pimeloyl-ACP methyl ester carboxylesterase
MVLVLALKEQVQTFVFAGHSLGGTAAFCLAIWEPNSRAVVYNGGAAPTNPVYTGPGSRAIFYHIYGDLISSHMSGDACTVVRVKLPHVGFGLTGHSTEHLRAVNWKLVTAQEEQNGFRRWQRWATGGAASVLEYIRLVEHTLNRIPGTN